MWAQLGVSPPVLPTADAYAWLTGLDSVGRLSGWAMSDVIAWLSSFSGYAPEWIAFWLPAVLACLPGVVIAGVCWQRGHPVAGLAGGIFAAASLGYLGRTRLGYADTDLFALFLPTALAAIWAWAIDRLDGQRAPGSGGAAEWMLPGVLLIAVAGLAQWAYPSGFPVLVAISVMAAGLGVWLLGRAASGTLLALLAALLLASSFGWWGVLGGFGLVLLLARRGPARPSLGVVSLVVAVVLIAVLDWAFLQQTWTRLSAYTGWAGPRLVSNWTLPGVDASIQETGAVSWAEYIQRVGTHWTFLLLGLAGFVVTVIRWPSLLTFFPLLVLGLLSIDLGHRFAMYAAAPLGLGIGLGAATLLERMRRHRRLEAFIHIALAGVVVAVIGWHARDLRPEPAVSPRWADSLKELRHLDSSRGRIWAWWDEGYPAQFYGRLPTLADGGNASRLRTFALGQVFGARDPQRAASFVRRSAAERQRAMRSSEDWRRASYEVEPLETMTHRDARHVQRLLERPERLDPRDVENLPDEFVVASWKTLRKAQWADLYGRWRLTGGEHGYGRIATIRPPVQFDGESGLLETADGPVALRSMHILDASGSSYRNHWDRADGAHAIINNEAGEGVVMDADLFGTLAVQLLVGDPAELAPHFKLVVDAAPAARIYRVR
ncbi:STT3 domain-containing protein [Wenzhouxiangella sp. EGI_FJ10305]|uniref:STT3 domain-containing protein n=1 Tax=Wenzhouxiangella sp. EGI_FJ10305 TaxID=3243768 RepID=UPI0035DD9572